MNSLAKLNSFISYFKQLMTPSSSEFKVGLHLFSAECTIGMVRGLMPLKYYGTMALWK